MNTVTLKGNTKAEIFAAYEAVLAELLTQREVAKVEVAQTEVKRDKSIFIAAAQKQRAEFTAARTEFVRSWCAANGVSSVPGDVVASWAAARR